MQRKQNGTVEWLEFDLLTKIPELAHGVFLREGGVSAGPFRSLNVGDGTGDKPENIEENCERIRSVLQLDKLIRAHQEHGVKIDIVSDPLQEEMPPCDGFLTDIRKIGLLINHADCQVGILYDPVHHAIGCVHAGWRGNVKNVYGVIIEKMKKKFKTHPRDLIVCISPSLGPKWAEFKNYKEEFPETFWEFQVEPNYFDLWAIARMQLEEAGVLPEHIEIASLCTYTHLDDFYSYRRDKVTGRNGTVVALK